MAQSVSATQSQQHKPVDFLIITALREERDAVLSLLDNPQKEQIHGSPTYYRATLPTYSQNGDYEIAVTMLNNMGNVEAAQHATRAINDLTPNYILMVGIAGGIRRQVRLGDVIVANHILYYEPTKITSNEAIPRPISCPVDDILLDRTQNYTKLDWHDLIRTARPSVRGRNSAINLQAQVTFGIIATGENVVADEAFVKQLQKLQPKVIGIEMESFGVALAAAKNLDRPRFIAIRGVSDYADSSKNDQWHRYAAESAAAFTIGFLYSGPVPSRSTLIERLTTDATLIAIRHQSMEPIAQKALIPSLPPDMVEHHIVELVIDQANLYHDGRLNDPLEAARRQINLEEQLNDLLKIYPQAKIAYYGIAHIPLLFLAGYRLSNRLKVLFYDQNYGTGEWNQLQRGGEAPPLAISGLSNRIRRTKGPVVICISISYRVTPDIVKDVIPKPIASLLLEVENPYRGIVTSERQVHAYGEIFRTVMDQIHNMLPNATSIHIFYSGPPSVAFYYGQQISKTVHPPIIVYNYVAKDTPSYSWGIDITRSVDDPNFIVRPTKAGG